MKRLIFAVPIVWGVASPAFAHTGIGDAHGAIHGFMHPLSGVDHSLAMVAVGLFAVTLSGRAVWAVPLTFVATMAAAGVVGMLGIPLPMVETGIGLSVVALGAVLAFRVAMPLALAMAFVGLFAIFHGYAHGAEMPNSASGLAYGVGFVAATAMLHAIGIGIGWTPGRLSDQRGYRVARVGGAAMALAGVGMLTGVL